VVDDDTDLFENAEVDWAIITRVQPDRDIVIIPRCHGIFLDPSSPSPGVTAKLFIDATKKEGFKAKVAEPTKAMMETIQKRWGHYGFKLS
ncbi:MAG: UbiD family decarboxylase, partial [Dehalococcoidales bacterium]|nr:UbiD family decarboxylase [Dehalococcoidales bacterium]